MKIGYIFSDWKGSVSGSTGHSVHIREMCQALGHIGHEVFIVARSDGSSMPGDAVVHELGRPPLLGGSGLRARALSARRAGGGEEALARATTDGSPAWAAKDVATDVVRAGWGMTCSRDFARRARPVIARERPDLLYERYVRYGGAGTSLARRFRLPLILEMNTSFTFASEWWHRHSPVHPLLVRQAERRICRRADRIVVVSSYLQTYLRTIGVPPGRTLLMPNAADPDRFRPDPALRGTIRQAYGLEGKIVVGFLGSLKPWHDLGLVVRIAGRVLESARSVHFLIAGDGPLRGTLEQDVRRAGLNSHFTFAGAVSPRDAPAYMNAMDVALAPTPPLPDFHFSPIKIFEYMATARPVIASRYPDTEAVIAEGENGLLVEPGAGCALARAISRLVENEELRTRLGQNARRTVQERFTWRANAGRIAEVYGELQSGRGGTWP